MFLSKSDLMMKGLSFMADNVADVISTSSRLCGTRDAQIHTEPPTNVCRVTNQGGRAKNRLNEREKIPSSVSSFTSERPDGADRNHVFCVFTSEFIHTFSLFEPQVVGFCFFILWQRLRTLFKAFPALCFFALMHELHPLALLFCSAELLHEQHFNQR